jgi:hypothetical protein
MPCDCLLCHFCAIPNAIVHRYGFTAGGEALASSVASAMEGVLVRGLFIHVDVVLTLSLDDPDKTYRGGGVGGRTGFFQRCWKGYSRVSMNNGKCIASWMNNGYRAVTKPVVGVFDLASNVSEGKFGRKSTITSTLKSCSRYSEHHDRLRQPRP